MTRQVITVAPDSAIVDAAHKMLQHHISGLPVVNEAGNLIGIVSEGDFLRRKEIGTQKSAVDGWNFSSAQERPLLISCMSTDARSRTL
jgi:CBS domain-containing protein